MPSPALIVGVDSAAKTLAVVLVPADAPPAPATILPNAAAGWQTLMQSLIAAGATPATTLLVMEATGAYWQGLATALHTAGWPVSVVSPASVRSFARARLRRAKTDAVDAAVIADFGRRMTPNHWTPPPAEVEALRLLLRQRDDLIALRTQTRNRQHALAQLPALPAALQTPLAAVLRVVEEQIGALDAAIKQQAGASVTLATEIARLTTITGVGVLTAAVVLTETRPLRDSATPAEVVAFAGLDPAPKRSARRYAGRNTSARRAMRGCDRRSIWRQ